MNNPVTYVISCFFVLLAHGTMLFSVFAGGNYSDTSAVFTLMAAVIGLDVVYFIIMPFFRQQTYAVDFMLIKYDHGKTTPLTEPVASTCYRTSCTISVDFIGNQLSAHVETSTPQPADSTLPKQVDLKATVTPNAFGGVHIQHTGSCGESTTMLHQLDVCWKLP